jgi:hypothetical protein
MIRKPALILASTAFLAVSCAQEGPCVGVPNLLDTPDGIRLTEEEHSLGWGQAECFQCHLLAEIHQGDCSDVGLSAERIAATVDLEDPDSCQICHGSNGTSGGGR